MPDARASAAARPASRPPGSRAPRALVAAVALLAAACAPVRVAPPAAGPAAVVGPAAVASPERHATDAGVAILEAGGNAVDAAIAVHFALAVTFPSAGNLGGGGFLLVHDASAESATGDAWALDYRETAPRAASRDMYLDADGDVVPGESLYTHRAAGVPGSVAGMWEAHRRFGSLPWDVLIEPAIRLAEDGFPLDGRAAAAIAKATGRFSALDEARREQVDFACHFAGEEGDRLVQPDLAATLRRIAADGPDGFYRGETARLIVEEMERGGGLVTAEDLAAYRPAWRAPVEGTYRGRRVVSMPPPSSGGVALLQMLAMLERFEPPARLSVRHVHLMAEAAKRAFADRSFHLGDPDHVDVPVAALLAPSYLAGRAASISLEARSDPASIAPAELPVAVPESVETTHFGVTDGDGLAVSCTTTLNAGFGSGIVVDGAGFLLNNEMDDFSAKPGVPNLYGVVGAEANAIAPGKRMLSSMTPTFVFDREGRLELVLGSPGGPTIITSVLQVLLNVVDYGLSLDEAVAAPRAHHQWPPRVRGRDRIVVEDDAPYRLPGETLEGLERLGYAIERVPTIGDVQAVRVTGDIARGVADARRGGTARSPRH